MKQEKKDTQSLKSYDHGIRKVGIVGNKSLVITLPRAHCRELDIEKGTLVRVQRTIGGGFLITKVQS